MTSLRARLGRWNRQLDVELWYPKPAAPAAATLLTVYRRANASNVEAMAGAAAAAGWDVRLWALDEVAPSLERWTTGTGPGTRFQLINQLIDHEEIPADHYVVVSDDDVTFDRRNVVSFLAYAQLAGADIAQPAHSPPSLYSWRFTLSAARTVARRTSFVEIGPVFSLSPAARVHLLPLPEEGMGWGVEFQWSQLQARGIVLAIVDATTVCHHGSVAVGYDLHRELTAVEERAQAAGFTGLADIQVEHQRWRPWQRRPPRWGLS